MDSFRGTDLTPLTGRRADGLRREARDSVALVLVTLAILVTVSFLGLALG